MADPGSTGEIRHHGEVATTQVALDRLIRRIAKARAIPLNRIAVCYEAGGCGMWIARNLKSGNGEIGGVSRFAGGSGGRAGAQRSQGEVPGGTLVGEVAADDAGEAHGDADEGDVFGVAEAVFVGSQERGDDADLHTCDGWRGNGDEKSAGWVVKGKGQPIC